MLSEKPLVFLHVPKTGGTSLSEAIGRLYPRQRCFTDNGNITIDFIRSIEMHLAGECFIFGHAGRGVVEHLRTLAAMITILRRPMDQAVSNYLHVLDDPDNALHPSAIRQSFTAYLRENPGQIAFQAGSLALALSTEEQPVDHFQQSGIALIRKFLSSMPFVGVIDRPDECHAGLARLLRCGPEFALPHMNSAVYRGISSKWVRSLGQEYRNLAWDGDLSTLFAVEAQLYATADARLTALSAEAPCAEARAGRRNIDIPSGRFTSTRGARDGEDFVCPLAGVEAHMIYGPFETVPRGDYAAQFRVSLPDAPAPGTGRLEFEVLANGRRCLAKRWKADIRDLAGPGASQCAPTLLFRNDDDWNILEFRIKARGFGGGALAFSGVRLRPAHRWLTLPSRVFALVRGAATAARRRLAPAGKTGSGDTYRSTPVSRPEPDPSAPIRTLSRAGAG